MAEEAAETYGYKVNPTDCLLQEVVCHGGCFGALQRGWHDVLAFLHPLRRSIKRDWCLNLSFCLRPRKENSAAKWDSPCLGFLLSQRAGTCCKAVKSIAGSKPDADVSGTRNGTMYHDRYVTAPHFSTLLRQKTSVFLHQADLLHGGDPAAELPRTFLGFREFNHRYPRRAIF